MSFTKEQILEEIKRTAKENAGVPLGRGRFEKETGINEYDIHKYWATYREAHQEAGLAANTLRSAHKEEFVFESVETCTAPVRSESPLPFLRKGVTIDFELAT